jgi:hypothetical protein
MITKIEALLLLLLCASVTQAIESEEISTPYQDLKEQTSEKDLIYEAYEIPAFKSHDLNEIKLFHSNNSFSVWQEGEVKNVNHCWVYKEIRSL